MPQMSKRMLTLALMSLLALCNGRIEAEPETPRAVQVFSPTFSAFRPPLSPPYLRFFGTLRATDAREREPGELRPVSVSIGQTQWMFHLEDVEALNGSNPGSMILAQVFPRQLRFVGPIRLMQQLQDPAVAGKFIVVEGRLYISSRQLLVTSVVGAEEVWQQ